MCEQDCMSERNMAEYVDTLMNDAHLITTLHPPPPPYFKLQSPLPASSSSSLTATMSSSVRCGVEGGGGRPTRCARRVRSLKCSLTPEIYPAPGQTARH